MIKLGSWNELKILRYTSVGLYLGGEGESASAEATADKGEGTGPELAEAIGGKEEVLLPKKYCPTPFNIGDTIKVFVYRDSEDRMIATTLTPYITLGEFAFLKVKSVNDMGAFMEWGLEKDLMVPFREQKRKIEEGRWYVIYLTIDTQTDRLVGSNKPDKFLQNEELFVKKGEEVDLIVLKKHEMGYDVAVNHLHKGMLYHNEVFSEIKTGDSLRGFVRRIRPDNKLDIGLQAHGYEQSIDENTTILLDQLREHGGFLPLTDKSPPEEVYAILGISKKAFKKALGGLYKEKRVRLGDKGIKCESRVDQ